MCAASRALQFVTWLCFLLVSLCGRQESSRALLARVDQLQGNSTHDALDIPEQRAALLKLYDETRGDHWLPSSSLDNNATATWHWNKKNTTYCRWPGVLCRSAAEHLEQSLEASSSSTLSSAADGSDVVGLLLTGVGLRGTLPSELSQLWGLQVLLLADNPGLAGAWPRDLQLESLQYLAVANTSLTACRTNGTVSPFKVQTSCDLHSDFVLSSKEKNYNMPGQEGVMCPRLQFANSQDSKHQLNHTTTSSHGDSTGPFSTKLQPAPPRAVWWWLLQASVAHAEGSDVVASLSFFGAAGCNCMVEGQILIPPDESVASRSNPSNPKGGIWTCDWQGGISPTAYAWWRKNTYVLATTSLLSPGFTALIVYLVSKRLRWLCLQYKKDCTKGIAEAEAGEMTLAAKRSRFPGTPSVALAKGSGILSLSDVLVTWVVTDVEGSTQLWEWDAEVMGAAVELHNSVLRGLLEQFGGHEVRTDGDSFTLAFHDAADAVAYCVKAQEQLLEVPWPPKLLEHPYCTPMHLGAACIARNPTSQDTVQANDGQGLKDQGMLLMAGLRVRMGINTGVPDDILVHDLTEHVEYRGEEYALTDDIAGVAAGGQILMGPKTFQRWNRIFSQAPVDVNPTGDGASCVDVHTGYATGHCQQGTATMLHLHSPEDSTHNGWAGHTPPKRGTGSFLMHGLDLMTNAIATQLWRRQSEADNPNGFGEAVSRVGSLTRGTEKHHQHEHIGNISQSDSTVVTRGDTLLLFSSLGASAEAAARAEFIVEDEGHVLAVVQRSKNLPAGQPAVGTSASVQTSSEASSVAEPPVLVGAPQAPAASAVLAGRAVNINHWQAAVAAVKAGGSYQNADCISEQQCMSMSLTDSPVCQAAGPKVKKSAVGGITYSISTASAGSSASNTGGSRLISRQAGAAAAKQQEYAISTGSPASSRIVHRRMRKSIEGAAEATTANSPNGTRRNTKEEEGYAARYSTNSTGDSLPVSNHPPIACFSHRRASNMHGSCKHEVHLQQNMPGASSRPPAEGAEADKQHSSWVMPNQQQQEATASVMAAELCCDKKHAAANLLQRCAGPVAEAKEQSGAGASEFISFPPVIAEGRAFSGFTVASSGPSSSSPYAAGLKNIRAWMGSTTGRASRQTTDEPQQIDEDKSSKRGNLSLWGYFGQAASAAGTALKASTKPSRDGCVDETSVHGRQPSILRLWSMRKRFLSPSSEQQMIMPGSDAPELSSSQVVLLDLGYYQWKPDGYAGAVDMSGQDAAAAAAVQAVAHQEAAAAAEGGLLHLVQLQSKRLAPRMLLFGWPLKACEGDDALMHQLLPGFLDAPGASSLMFPAQRKLLEDLGLQPPAKPEVALAFVAPAGIKEVHAALGAKVAQACQALFTSIVREVLLAVGGYESKEVDGQVMAAFHGPRQAVEWALVLQCALLQAPWPPQLAQLKSTACVNLQAAAATAVDAPPSGSASIAKQHQPEQHQGDGIEMTQPGSDSETACTNTCSTFYSPANVFKGIRARVGIWSGPMDRVLPHGRSGRSDYLGPPANRAARMMAAAQGGQVLVEESTMKAVLVEWQKMEQETGQQRLNFPSTAAAAGYMPAATTPGASELASSCSSSCSLPPKRRGQHRAQKQTDLCKPGTGLFSNVFDNALYCSSPSLLSPVPAKMLRTAAPWESEVGPDSGTMVSSRLPSQKVSADQSCGVAAGDGCRAHGSTCGVGQPAQVLTITPAAYHPTAMRRATKDKTPSYHHSCRSSARNTSSSAGTGDSTVSSAVCQVMSDMVSMAGRRRSFTLTVSSIDGPQKHCAEMSSQQPGQCPEAVGVSMDYPAGWLLASHQKASQKNDRRLSIGSSSIDLSELSKAVAAALGPVQPATASHTMRSSLELQQQTDDKPALSSHLMTSQQTVQRQNLVIAAASDAAIPSTAYSSARYASNGSSPAGNQKQQLAQAACGTSDLSSSTTASRPQSHAVPGDLLVADISKNAHIECGMRLHEQGTGHPAAFLAQLLPPSTFVKTPAKLINDSTAAELSCVTSNGCSAASGMSAKADAKPLAPLPTLAIMTCDEVESSLDQCMSVQSLSTGQASAEASNNSNVQDRLVSEPAGIEWVFPAAATAPAVAGISAGHTSAVCCPETLRSLPFFLPPMRKQSQLSIVIDDPAVEPCSAATAGTDLSMSHKVNAAQAAESAAAPAGLAAFNDIQLQMLSTTLCLSNAIRPSLLQEVHAEAEMANAINMPRTSAHSQAALSQSLRLLGSPRCSGYAQNSNLRSSLKDLVLSPVAATRLECGRQSLHQVHLHGQAGRSEISSANGGEGGNMADISSSNGAAAFNSSSPSNSNSGSGGAQHFNACCTPTAVGSNPMLQSLAKVRVNRLMRHTDTKRGAVAGSELLNTTFAPMSPRVGAAPAHLWGLNSASGALATPTSTRRITGLSVFRTMRSSSGSGEQLNGASHPTLPPIESTPAGVVQLVHVKSRGEAHAVRDSRSEHTRLRKSLTNPLPSSKDGSIAQVGLSASRLSKSNNGVKSNSSGSCQPIPETHLLPSGGIFGGSVQHQRMSAWQLFTAGPKSAMGSGSQLGAIAAPSIPITPGRKRRSVSIEDEAFGQALSDGPTRGTIDIDKGADPGVIAECFKIVSGALGDAGSSAAAETITMIKYTALEQQSMMEDTELHDDMRVIPRLAMAAAAAAAVAAASSTSISSSGSHLTGNGSGMRTHFAHIFVPICARRVGGFKLKGVDPVVEVVSVMPESLEQRIRHLLPATILRGKSKCVGPASGLCGKGSTWLPDLTELVAWISAPMIEQQRVWEDEQQLEVKYQQHLMELEQRQQQVLLQAQMSKRQMLQHRQPAGVTDEHPAAPDHVNYDAERPSQITPERTAAEVDASPAIAEQLKLNSTTLRLNHPAAAAKHTAPSNSKAAQWGISPAELELKHVAPEACHAYSTAASSAASAAVDEFSIMAYHGNNLEHAQQQSQLTGADTQQ